MKKIFLNIALTALITLLPACNGKAARSEGAPDPPQSIVAPIANPGSLRAVEKAKEYVMSNREKAESLFTIIYEDPIPGK